MSRIVVLAGGSPHAHDFVESGSAVVDVVNRTGHHAELVDDPDNAARLLDRDVAALVVNGLWWRMLGDTYDPWRADYGYSPPTATRKAILAFVAGGGGLVALHAAPICFDDWPEWGDVVGGSWVWNVSAHPPYGPVSAHVVAEHPIVAGVSPRIELVDEVYGDLDIRDGVEVLVTARRHATDADQPVVWAHRFGMGRVVFDGFGHNASSINHAANARLIGQAVGWVTEPR